MPTVIDMTPTWGEWGAIYRRFAETGQTRAVAALAKDHARAMAACEALQALIRDDRLTPEQHRLLHAVMTRELTKQGFAP